VAEELLAPGLTTLTTTPAPAPAALSALVYANFYCQG
jgi:hypothetical protein